ncbi:hypothetical protein [Nostoc sp. FACHB-280]|uniref:hypothetical protein n=1 Tax=Nostoc sp. FACHB-280 TaxID=2692839 RepID=UPI00168BDCD4|nr:hypothetical protein [Nostoc sp. FACHB-280]MBD2498988.1 hypothetical protein [Nostoc sp. FACHB-280]
MQDVVQGKKSRKTALLRLTKASERMRGVRQCASQRRLMVFGFASVIGESCKNQHQQSELLTIASTLQVKLCQQVELNP